MSSEDAHKVTESADRGTFQDETDAKILQVQQDTGSGRVDSLPRQSEGSVKDDRYQMTHGSQGEFIIINNKKFEKSTKRGERLGSKEEEENLAQEIKRLGFNVSVYKDQTTTEMLRLMRAASKRDHKESDCFGVAVLTYGDDSNIYGIDGEIPVEKFVEPIIKDCETLVGKPKIFFFQACRGGDKDKEVCDSGSSEDSHRSRRIPLEADHIYVHSGLPSALFLGALNKTLREDATNINFLTLLIRVNQDIVSKVEAGTVDVAKLTNRKNQVPTITSTFTKDLYFTERK